MGLSIWSFRQIQSAAKATIGGWPGDPIGAVVLVKQGGSARTVEVVQDILDKPKIRMPKFDGT